MNRGRILKIQNFDIIKLSHAHIVSSYLCPLAAQILRNIYDQ